MSHEHQPAPHGSRAGNRASANRWAAIIRRLGHRVKVSTDYHGEPADLMVGLHAWRTADAIARFGSAYPERPLVVVLTGTDAYRFIYSHRETTLASLDAADHIVGLHTLVGNVLPERLRGKLRVIMQSARPLQHRQPVLRSFRVCFAGHLREEKDPLRPALVVQELPADSRIRVDAYEVPIPKTGQPPRKRRCASTRATAGMVRLDTLSCGGSIRARICWFCPL